MGPSSSWLPYEVSPRAAGVGQFHRAQRMTRGIGEGVESTDVYHGGPHGLVLKVKFTRSAIVNDRYKDWPKLSL